jgi:hypothetical protein
MSRAFAHADLDDARGHGAAREQMRGECVPGAFAHPTLTAN